MKYNQDNILLIIGLLLLLVIIEGIYIMYINKKNKGNKGDGSTGYVSKEKHSEIIRERDKYCQEVKQLKEDNDKKDKEYVELYRDYKRLEQENKELTRNNDELNKLIDNEPDPTFSETPIGGTKTSNNSKPVFNEKPVTDDQEKASQHPVQDQFSTVASNNNSFDKGYSKAESSKEKTKYASFPRTAGSSIYFSDLSDNLADDSYFELKISVGNGNATFKPIDFMKIRNYDPAMAAMLTEGVKPNVASTVIGIEPGMAHLEGNDWIIDNLAKIKLA